MTRLWTSWMITLLFYRLFMHIAIRGLRVFTAERLVMLQQNYEKYRAA